MTHILWICLTFQKPGLKISTTFEKLLTEKEDCEGAGHRGLLYITQSTLWEDLVDLLFEFSWIIKAPSGRGGPCYL